MRTDGPGFSLRAVPLESYGPGFQDRRGDGMNEWRSRVYQTGVGRGDNINGVGNRFVAEQRAYDPHAELARATENITRLNPGQKLVHGQILASVLRSDSQGRPQGRPFFVHGPGGTGKSFT